MPSMSDEIAANEPVHVPTQYQQHSVYDTATGVGEAATGPTGRMISDEREMLLAGGIDPDVFRIVGKIHQWTKTHADKPDTYSFLFSFETIKAAEEALDLPALYAEANRKPRNPRRGTADSRVTVVALSDVQAGKVGSRGGTPELLDRLHEKRELLSQLLRNRNPQSTVLAEVGDLFEGFESGGNPMFTNDLSLAQQMDLAGTEMYKFIELMHVFGPVSVACIPSNHTAWRNGKQNLGRPSDDLGLFVHRQVEKVAKAAQIDAQWTYPAEYDESVVLDILGTRVGVVHGNQYAPNGAVNWWAGQTHGGQPVGAADILLAGHYHHLNVLPTGRNPYTGRAKWFLQCPTLDNGSDWYRNIKGDDSSPGLLVFDITEDGFDLTSLTVL